MTEHPERGRAWLEALFTAHHREVLAYASRRVPSHEADDVVAEVFTAAWQHRERVPDPALPWLYRTASHHVLHAYRGHGRRERLTRRLERTPQPDETDHAEGVATRLDDAAIVGAALARLSATDAETLRLSVWEGLTTGEIAYVVGCSPTAAKVRLHRARRRFSVAVQGADPTVRSTAKETTA